MRNKIIALILTMFLVFCLVGCSNPGSKNYTENTGGILQPTMMKNLYYDSTTKIVYILFNLVLIQCISNYFAVFYPCTLKDFIIYTSAVR